MRRGRCRGHQAQVNKSSMPIADLNSSAQVLILEARRELQPAAGERERLEALLSTRLGVSAIEAWTSLDHSMQRSPDSAR